MEGLHCNVCTSQSALEKAPEVLDPLGVDIASDVLFQRGSQSRECIPAPLGCRMPGSRRCRRLSPSYLREDGILKSLPLHVWHDLGAYLSAVAVEHPHHDSLAVARSQQCVLHPQPAPAMHLLRVGDRRRSHRPLQDHHSPPILFQLPLRRASRMRWSMNQADF